MSAQQPSKDHQQTEIMDETIANEFSPVGKNLDDEEDGLIAQSSKQEEPKHILYEGVADQDAIDPFQELVKNNDVVPLLAVLDRIDLNTVVEGKPLLSRLCTLHLPLNQLLKGREIHFTFDDDKRTALHEAIAADDVNSAFWCMQKKIGNSRDNFGNTPILQAIKLGRRSCFLLCLHYDYLDSEATHACAIYNRAWELKILHRMGMDIFWQRDSQHFTPLQRSVQNYSFDVAQFIVAVNPKMATKDLTSKTDSKGIINLVNRIKSEYSYFNYAILPLIMLACHIFILYRISITKYFVEYQQPIGYALVLLLGLKSCLNLFSYTSNNSTQRPPDFLGLLKAPEFPPMTEICPLCLSHPERNTEHCLRCDSCIPKYHYHGLVCVNKSNEVFWFLSEICWFWLLYSMHEILYNNFQRHSLKILNFSSNIFFGNAAILDHLWQESNYLIIAVFIYIKLFMIYQFMCLFQWLYMLVLNRTYQEANHSEKYTKLFRIGKTMDGNFKSEEIRLMENGFIPGVLGGLGNALLYFFR